LEHHGNSLDVVVFAVENIDVGIYEVLLPLYFPRSLEEEEMALWQLPANVGGPDGEPLLPDRQIRIIDNPQHSFGGELLRYFFHSSAASLTLYTLLLKYVMTLLMAQNTASEFF
jgi:hypothetical protein